jgi:hypothetical protein
MGLYNSYTIVEIISSRDTICEYRGSHFSSNSTRANLVALITPFIVQQACAWRAPGYTVKLPVLFRAHHHRRAYRSPREVQTLGPLIQSAV